MPVVTGIGHEIDFTIADFVADVRAPTPSGAAELVVPDARRWRHRLRAVARALRRGGAATLRSERTRLARLAQSPATHASGRAAAAAARSGSMSSRCAACSSRCSSSRLSARTQRACRRRDALRAARCVPCTGRAGARSAARACAAGAVSPLATLTRGFAVVTRADGSCHRRGAWRRREHRCAARQRRAARHGVERALRRRSASARRRAAARSALAPPCARTGAPAPPARGHDLPRSEPGAGRRALLALPGDAAGSARRPRSAMTAIA